MPRTWLSLYKTQLDDPNMQEFMADIEMTMQEWAEQILLLVRDDVLAYLQGYTSKKNPPRYRRKFFVNADSVRTKVTKKNVGLVSPNRPAHPGGWSDVENELRDSYYGQVVKTATGDAKLTIGNKSGHAMYVEAMQGLFVVSGVFDENGPVYKALKKYMRKYAPGMKVARKDASSLAAGTDAVTAKAL